MERGPTSIPRPTPIRARGSGCVSRRIREFLAERRHIAGLHRTNRASSLEPMPLGFEPMPCGNSRESQRDSAPKPRVASRCELPWEKRVVWGPSTSNSRIRSPGRLPLLGPLQASRCSQAATRFPSPPLEERDRERRSSFSTFQRDGLEEDVAGREFRTGIVKNSGGRLKSEGRRSKPEARTALGLGFRISELGLLSAFGFRNSGFGLQRVPHPPALSRFGNRRSPRVPMPRECAGVSRRAALLSKDSLRGAATKGQNKNPSARTRRGVSRGFLRLRGESQVTVCEPRGRTFALDPASESRN